MGLLHRGQVAQAVTHHGHAVTAGAQQGHEFAHLVGGQPAEEAVVARGGRPLLARDSLEPGAGEPAAGQQVTLVGRREPGLAQRDEHRVGILGGEHLEPDAGGHEVAHHGRGVRVEVAAAFDHAERHEPGGQVRSAVGVREGGVDRTPRQDQRLVGGRRDAEDAGLADHVQVGVVGVVEGQARPAKGGQVGCLHDEGPPLALERPGDDRGDGRALGRAAPYVPQDAVQLGGVRPGLVPGVLGPRQRLDAHRRARQQADVGDAQHGRLGEELHRPGALHHRPDPGQVGGADGVGDDDHEVQAGGGQREDDRGGVHEGVARLAHVEAEVLGQEDGRVHHDDDEQGREDLRHEAFQRGGSRRQRRPLGQARVDRPVRTDARGHVAALARQADAAREHLVAGLAAGPAAASGDD